jgi:KDO2-lipid IV(A) lauroyltransferase
MRDLLLAPVLAVFFRVLLVMPSWFLQFFGRVVGDLYRVLARRERRILRRNLRQVLEIDPQSPQGKALARDVFRHHVLAMLETLQGIFRPERIVIEGLGHLRHAFEQAELRGQGQILITAHLGSWEIIGRYVAEVTRGEFYELAKPSRIAPATRLLERIRTRAGSRVLWTGRRALLREMLTVLREGHTLGFAMDQRPEGLRGPVVSFFDQPTEFVPGPASLALKTGACVLAVFCVRLAPYQYRLFVDEVPVVQPIEVDQLTQVFATVLEERIRAYPEQWPWNYRRWVFPDDPWDSVRGRGKRAVTE